MNSTQPTEPGAGPASIGADAASPGPRRVTPAELARELKVSRQAIHDLQQRGKLLRDADGLFDLERARAALMQRALSKGDAAKRSAATLEREAARSRRAANYASVVVARISLLTRLIEKSGGDVALLTMADIDPLVRPGHFASDAQGEQ